MRKFPSVANRPALHVCLCVPEAGFVCRECQAGTVALKAQSIEEADGLGDEPSNWNHVGSKLADHEPPEVIDNAACFSRIGDNCPWNPDDLPERLRGFGYRGADQDGFDGSEWVTPQEDLEEQMLEAARVLLDAREV